MKLTILFTTLLLCCDASINVNGKSYSKEELRKILNEKRIALKTRKLDEASEDYGHLVRTRDELLDEVHELITEIEDYAAQGDSISSSLSALEKENRAMEKEVAELEEQLGMTYEEFQNLLADTELMEEYLEWMKPIACEAIQLLSENGMKVPSFLKGNCPESLIE